MPKIEGWVYRLYILVRAGMFALISQLLLPYSFGSNFIALSYTISE
jgi:hypothetical protein